jgi:hypothetical protein
MKKLLLCIFLSSTGFMLQASTSIPTLVASAPLSPKLLLTARIEKKLIDNQAVSSEFLKKIRANGGTIKINLDNQGNLSLESRIRLLGMEIPGTETQMMYDILPTPINPDKLTAADKSYIIETIYTAMRFGF